MLKPIESEAFKPQTKTWAPSIIDGGGYCSPGCGGHRSGVCTVEKFNSAVKLAEELAETMGPKWKPIVWENLGWHSKIARPGCSIYIHEHDYWIDFHITGLGQKHKTVEDAEQGFIEFVEELKRETSEAQSFLESLID